MRSIVILKTYIEEGEIYMIKRALFSVSDKTGIVELARELTLMGIEIVSTGGTEKVLKDAGIKVINISDVTGFPECLDGRLKTLHPKVHGGILAMRNNPLHMKQINELGITPIDLVVINLYPFKQTIMKDDVTLDEAIEKIDIGGPTMIRAAAKNYKDVAVVVDPKDYNMILSEIKELGDISLKIKFKLAYKVFEHTSSYDTLIATYIKKQLGEEFFPEILTLTFEKAQDMRYGENPHQKAVFYKETGKLDGCIAAAVQIHGKELSYNNINDTNGAIELIKEFDEPTIVAVKHANPCGVGSADTIYEAYKKAYNADPVSIFGGIIASNEEIDAETAEEINKIYIEIVIAPSFTEEAIQILTKKKNIRILKLDGIRNPIPKGTLEMKKVLGGLLVQDINTKVVDMDEIKYITDKKPTDAEMEDLIYAMKVVKHTKSNAIVIAKNKQTVGIGPGQLNRVTSAKIAFDYAGDRAKGAALASDAYFPFDDWTVRAAEAGIATVIQPGGSIKDQDSIDACNKKGIAMIFTGMRHFKH